MRTLKICLPSIAFCLIFVSGCTCSRQGPVETTLEEAPIEYAPNDYQAQPPDPKMAPSYEGITVDRVLPSEIQVGSGDMVKPGMEAEVRYLMWVYDPKRVGNKGLSLNPAKKQITRKIRIGNNDIVKGIDVGILGMKEGGKRSLIIPSHLAFGEMGSDSVPAKAIILAEVELVSASE